MKELTAEELDKWVAVDTSDLAVAWRLLVYGIKIFGLEIDEEDREALNRLFTVLLPKLEKAGKEEG